MLKILFTLDYEIHGNGEGYPYRLMVEPTRRLMDQFDRFGAKVTIMAEMAEILKFKEYRDRNGRDEFHYAQIINQLKEAVQRGHDVQLHLHCSFFNARLEEGCWAQDWSEYNFATLEEGRLSQVVRLGKDFLESELRPVKPDYRCIAFRAGNWAVQPSKNVFRALVANDIPIDTSVYKWGRRDGLVRFDYEHAHSSIIPWRADENDLCRVDPDSPLFEFPIYSENRRIGAFFSPLRLYRAGVSRLHRLEGLAAYEQGSSVQKKRVGAIRRGLQLLTARHAWKADFNQCSGRQLIGALRRAAAVYDTPGASLPFVLIGHSKLFTRTNERSLEAFLQHIRKHPDQFGFGTFDNFDLSRREFL